MWLAMEAWGEMQREADAKAPLETGGLLFGYWAERFEEAVVSHVIGPGPAAQHDSDSFRPDSEYQEGELAALYEKHARLQTYLGDWHTHPAGRLGLSRKDRRTLKAIAHHEDARAPLPIMAVLAGPFDASVAWSLGAWRWPDGLLRNALWPFLPRFSIRLFGGSVDHR